MVSPPQIQGKASENHSFRNKQALEEKYSGGMYLTKLIYYALERNGGGYLLCEVADYEITLNLLSFFDQIYQKN